MERGVASHETLRVGLNELADEGRLVIERTSKKGEQNYANYSLPPLTEHERVLVKKFQDLQYVVYSYSKILVEKKFDFPKDWKKKSKGKPIIKKLMKVNEKKFAVEMYVLIIKNKILLEQLYNLLPENGYSKIIREGKQMFDELDRVVMEIESTYNFSKNELFETMLSYNETEIIREIVDVTDIYENIYGIEITDENEELDWIMDELSDSFSGIMENKTIDYRHKENVINDDNLSVPNELEEELKILELTSEQQKELGKQFFRDKGVLEDSS